MRTSINIIGAGIGGLTAAIALQKKGFDVKIFEAAAELLPIGAGIIMASNAMQVFRRLGIADDVRQNGNVLQKMIIGNHRGEALQIADIQEVMRQYGEPSVALHRGALQRILRSHLAPNTLQLSKRVEKVVLREASVGVIFTDGTTAESTVLVGADGLRSAVRRAIMGEKPLRYSTHTCWRGVVQHRLGDPSVARELWGKTGGKRLGLVQVDDEHVYFYFTLKAQAGASKAQMTRAMGELAEFPSEFADIVRKVKPENVYHDDLYDLRPLPNWWTGNALLLGDAAHATTPNLGQGGCQAVEDAWHLAECLAGYPSVSAAFSAFEGKRRAKVDFVVRTSYQVGLLSNLGGALGYRLRNALLRMTPASVNKKQFDFLFKID